MMVPVDPLLVAAAVPAVLTAWTAARSRAITRSFPATGRFVETRAGRLHVVDRGEGDVPAVFLHGASSSVRVWEPALGHRFDSLGRSILVDRPGHGFSERRSGRAAALACRIALDHPDRVAGLVLIAPATHPWPGGISWYYGVASRPVVGPLFSWTLALPAGEFWMKRSIAGVFAPQEIGPSYSTDAGIPLALRPRQFMANAEDCVALLGEVRAQAPRYGEIACPVTVISGEADGVVWTHLHSHGMARDVPQTRLILLPNVGHGPHHADPDRVAAEIRAMQASA
jgi:pimeloyl-ACP methyl ester carboxylesterase